VSFIVCLPPVHEWELAPSRWSTFVHIVHIVRWTLRPLSLPRKQRRGVRRQATPCSLGIGTFRAQADSPCTLSHITSALEASPSSMPVSVGRQAYPTPASKPGKTSQNEEEDGKTPVEILIGTILKTSTPARNERREGDVITSAIRRVSLI